MQEHLNQEQELLSQEVSNDELRQILNRIGEQQYGGPDHSTIRDIVEATSVPPQEIGLILADIRKEDWEKRFGLQIEDHEKRIENIEAWRTRNQPKPPIAQPQLSQDDLVELQQVAAQRRNGRTVFAVVTVAIMTVFLLAMLSFFTVSTSSTTRSFEPSSVTVETDGKRTYQDAKGDLMTNDHGKVREATPDEMMSWSHAKGSFGNNVR